MKFKVDLNWFCYSSFMLATTEAHSKKFANSMTQFAKLKNAMTLPSFSLRQRRIYTTVCFLFWPTVLSAIIKVISCRAPNYYRRRCATRQRIERTFFFNIRQDESQCTRGSSQIGNRRLSRPHRSDSGIYLQKRKEISSYSAVQA